jgi:hypothetical protein
MVWLWDRNSLSTDFVENIFRQNPGRMCHSRFTYRNRRMMLNHSLPRQEKRIDFDSEKLCKKSRLTGLDKNKRDLLIYFLWRSGKLTNLEIGVLCSLSYSAVSHSVKSIKSKLNADRQIQRCFDQINSQFKL